MPCMVDVVGCCRFDSVGVPIVFASRTCHRYERVCVCREFAVGVEVSWQLQVM
jgi:hypothetical protein